MHKESAPQWQREWKWQERARGVGSPQSFPWHAKLCNKNKWKVSSELQSPVSVVNCWGSWTAHYSLDYK